MSLMGKLRLIACAVGGAIYLGLGYLASSSTHPPLLAVIITALPVMIGLIAISWRTLFFFPALALSALLLIVSAQRVDLLLSHVAWLFFFQHVGAMTALGIMFGKTLGTHEEALCSRIAQAAIAAPLDARYFYYTWKVTLGWTIYFVASASISIALFFGGSLAAWSLFAAVIAPVSVPAMFVCEYLIRLRALPDRPHFSIAETFASYRKYVKRDDCAK